MLFHTRPHACAHFFGARGSKSRAAGTVLDRELGLLLRTYLVLLFTSSLAHPLSVVGDKDDSSERLPHSPEFGVLHICRVYSSPFLYVSHIPIRYPGCLLPAAVITMIWTTTITRTTRGSGDITCPFRGGGCMSLRQREGVLSPTVFLGSRHLPPPQCNGILSRLSKACKLH